MRALRFAAFLAAALAVHFLGTYLFASFPVAFDVFLVVAVFHALDGKLVAGLLGGAAAGLLTDTLTGGPWGLFGIADTLVGYGTALAALRLVIQRASGVLLLFGLAAAGQQAVLTLLVVVFFAAGEHPAFVSVLLKVVTSGVLGLALYRGRQMLNRRLSLWRRSRASRLRLGISR